MRLAILSDPNNFHTQKWARALMDAGARVTVFSFESFKGDGIHAVQIKAPFSLRANYSYLSYLAGGKKLAIALKEHNINLVNALNVTPFGVWAVRSGFHPFVASALGADILEYPPENLPLPHPESRSWNNIEGDLSGFRKWRQKRERFYYRKKVSEVLEAADLVTGDNQYLIDSMQKWFDVPVDKTKLVRWGVEEEMFKVDEAQIKALKIKYRIAEGQKVVLSPRGAKAIYQADIILDAFEKLLKSNEHQTKFIMLSAGYEVSEKVKRKAMQMMNDYPSFHFATDLVPREEVYALWNLVDVFISAPVYDGYSASIAEGRFIGAIPVVNDIPPNREVIEHGKNGWVVSPFTSDNLATELAYILQNAERLKSLFANQNKEWILKHSLVKNNAKFFLDLCSKLHVR